MVRLRDFLSLQSPLIVTYQGGQVVALAFGLVAGFRGGKPVAMILAPDGGTTQWVPIADLTFPAPIQARPPSGPVRANAGRTVRAVLQ